MLAFFCFSGVCLLLWVAFAFYGMFSLFCSMFVILGFVCNSRCARCSGLCLLFWALFVFQCCVCYSGMFLLFLDVFVILICVCYSRMCLLFWACFSLRKKKNNFDLKLKTFFQFSIFIFLVPLHISFPILLNSLKLDENLRFFISNIFSTIKGVLYIYMYIYIFIETSIWSRKKITLTQFYLNV